MRPLPTTQRDDGAEQARNDGVRRVRRMSNWTAAALVVGTGATAVALAHNALPAAGPVSSSAFTGAGATGTGTAGSTAGSTAGGPHVAHTVATTSASGVTTTTTTRVVNGHTVVTHHTSAPAYHDN